MLPFNKNLWIDSLFAAQFIISFSPDIINIHFNARKRSSEIAKITKSHFIAFRFTRSTPQSKWILKHFLSFSLLFHFRAH